MFLRLDLVNKYTTKSEVKSSFELEVNDRTRGTGQVGYKVTELKLPDLGCCCSWHARHCQPMDARIGNGCQAICKYVVACDGLFQPHSVLVSRVKDVVDIRISTKCGWKELQFQGADQVSSTCSPKSPLAKERPETKYRNQATCPSLYSLDIDRSAAGPLIPGSTILYHRMTHCLS